MQMILQDIDLGKKLKELRKHAGYSQSAICAQAQLLGSTISRSTYSQIELGRRNIKASDLIILKHILKTSYDVIFEGGTSFRFRQG